MAKESADLIGDIDADKLRAMTKEQQIISISNQKAVNARLPDYLMDAPFAGQFDPNPMFETDEAPAKRRPPRAR